MARLARHSRAGGNPEYLPHCLRLDSRLRGNDIYFYTVNSNSMTPPRVDGLNSSRRSPSYFVNGERMLTDIAL